MNDAPYVQELLQIREELIAGLSGEKAKVDAFRARVARYPTLTGLNRRSLLWKLQNLSGSRMGADIRDNPSEAAELLARQCASSHVYPFVLKACRLVLHALREGRLLQVKGLWGALVGLRSPPQDDHEVISFWKYTVVKLLKASHPLQFGSIPVGPWFAVDECATCCSVLADLFEKPKIPPPHPEPSEGQWSEILTLDFIARCIDCREPRTRSVEIRLKQIDSALVQRGRQQFVVRLDTMREPYRARF